jgi:hypothetical protein
MKPKKFVPLTPEEGKKLYRDILESKEPIFTIRIFGDKKNYSDTKLYLNGNCLAKHHGDINKIPNSSLANYLYFFVRMLELPPKITASSKDGSLLSLLAACSSMGIEK